MLQQKEIDTIKDLQTQEQSCVQKYEKYANEAKDCVLKDLFNQLKKSEQKHYDSLCQVLAGNVPECDCNDTSGRDYAPTATYTSETEDKKADCFLATDCIGTEKMVSHEYDNKVFMFGDTRIRKLLADIQIEEQNHAEMLYKYKVVNGMA